jgi:hypothetical protein
MIENLWFCLHSIYIEKIYDVNLTILNNLLLIVISATGARCVRKKKEKKNYIILQGGELTCFHFFKSSC